MGLRLFADDEARVTPSIGACWHLFAPPLVPVEGALLLSCCFPLASRVVAWGVLEV